LVEMNKPEVIATGDGMALTSLPNYLDSRALKCHNFVEFTVSNFVNPLQAL